MKLSMSTFLLTYWYSYGLVQLWTGIAMDWYSYGLV